MGTKPAYRKAELRFSVDHIRIDASFIRLHFLFMQRATRIRQILTAHFEPISLQVLDDSGKHQGHAGAQPEGETHYRIEMISERFSGLSRIERHRLVNDTLQKELDTGLHALQLILKAPGEL